MHLTLQGVLYLVAAVIFALDAVAIFAGDKYGGYRDRAWALAWALIAVALFLGVAT